MTSAAVVDTAGSAVVSTGETILDVVDLITPDILNDE